MKHTVTPTPEAFQPITVTLTLESQAEVDMVYAVFNSINIDIACKTAFGCSLPSINLATKDFDGCNRLHSALNS